MSARMSAEIVEELFAVIESRKTADPEASYVAKKFARGVEHIAKKVGEEGVEVALAAAIGKREEIVYESADLIFHLLVLWSATGIAPADVFEELKSRRGVSGLAREKDDAAERSASGENA